MTTPLQKNEEGNEIGNRRLLKVLDETIEKIKLALCLPVFLKNLDRFANHLSNDELIVLSKVEAYKSHSPKEDDPSYENDRDEEEVTTGVSSDSFSKLSQPSIKEKELQNFASENEAPKTNNLENPNLKKSIYMMWNRSDLVDIAKTEYLNSDPESPEFIFLETMHALRKCVHRRMMEDHSPEAEKMKILFYKEIWYKNEEAIAKKNSLEPLLNEIRSRIQVENDEKEKLISEMYRRMKNYDIKFEEEIDKLCYDSEKVMVVEYKSSEVRQEDIQNDIERLGETFQNTLNGHLKREKELRVKRFKIESQFEACLETYDIDMRDLQAEFDGILEEYKAEQQEMAELQDKFDEQEKEYIVLMEEKAYEEQLELERNIEDLRRRVAARIIQTHWRAMKKRRLERARSKRSKKGKKKQKNKRGGSKKPKPQKKGGKKKAKGK